MPIGAFKQDLVFGILVHRSFYISLFLLMSARGAVGLKLASKKPL